MNFHALKSSRVWLSIGAISRVKLRHFSALNLTHPWGFSCASSLSGRPALTRKLKMVNRRERLFEKRQGGREESRGALQPGAAQRSCV